MELSTVNKQPAGGAGSLAALDSLTTSQHKLRNFTSCRVCSKPLQPSIYQCVGKGRVAHIACAGCVGKLPGSECLGSENGGVFHHIAYMEKYLVGLEIKCKNAGCNMSVSCLDFLDHKRLCPHGFSKGP